jgi:hypothetical protein
VDIGPDDSDDRSPADGNADSHVLQRLRLFIRAKLDGLHHAAFANSASPIALSEWKDPQSTKPTQAFEDWLKVTQGGQSGRQVAAAVARAIALS